MIDEAVRIYKENVTPARQSKKGSRAGYFLTDRKTGKGVAITLWDNERDIIATEESGFFQEQLVKFSDCLTTPPVREIFEVSAHG
jgi:hypothetical protein